MSIALFQRGLKWRSEVNQKLEKRRLELLAQDPNRQLPNCSAASAADHIDSYWEYRRLVGESDGGTPLGEAEYAALRRLAAKAAKDRLFVTWRNMSTGMDCYNVGPDSRCHCGHSYKAHAWFETETKRVFCRCPGCRCDGFEYVVGHGAWWIKCICKHSHHEHDNGRGHCQGGGSTCLCSKFHSSFGCVCGSSWQEHATVIETRSERKASNRPTHNLCGGGGAGEAACGAITRMSSLVPGIDRIETPLPFTDAGFFAHRLPSNDSPGDKLPSRAQCVAQSGISTAEPTRQMLLDSLPDESLHLLLNLLDEPTKEERQQAADAEVAGHEEDEAAEGQCGPCDEEQVGNMEGANSTSSRTAGPPSSISKRTSRQSGVAPPKAKPPMSRSAILKSHDEELRCEIAELAAKLESTQTSAAAKHGLKKQLAMKKAALKRDAVPALAGR